MKKLRLNNAMTIYEETLPNGLKVYLAPDTARHNYLAIYGVHFGSTNLEFISPKTKKMTRYPSGIAHFLEHKVFEQEDGVDPFAFFAKSGADVNAATSFDSTRYYCYGTKNFKENLSYLIDFVNHPYFTDENVEKEKGIILEEYRMYKDIPDFQMEEMLHENLYQQDHKKIDVLGTEEDIKRITKEQLYECYHTFYRPSNMFLIIAGAFSEIEALDVIKTKDFPNDKDSIKQKEIKEPIQPCKEEAILKTHVIVPKIALGYKFDKKKFGLSELELRLYMNMILNLTFGATSNFMQEAREKQLLTSFGYDWEDEYHKNIRTLFMYADTTQPDYLIDAIQETFQNITISVEEIERLKKVWISSEIRMLDYVNNVGNALFNDVIDYHEPILNRVEFIRGMNKRTLDQVIKNMDLSHHTIVKVLQEEKKYN